MRPAGEVRLALLKALKDHPRSTSRTLAGLACIGVAAASKTLDNLVVAGKVVKRDSIRVAGVKRPVPTYEIYSTQLLQQTSLWSSAEVRQ